jgi:23S rRNA (cytidine1920-2'-O)/16S rRNA (cytidine1409-2'-O)-methyltransferase
LKQRLDRILISKGLVKSRELAKALILEGKVFVDGQSVTKAGALVNETSLFVLKENSIPFVSRGGLKLEAALSFFNVHIHGKVIMDVGSSTGGFTDCVLKRKAKKVYSIDVGYGQLDWSIRNDPRVVVLERTNVRYLDKMNLEELSRKKEYNCDELMYRTIDMAMIDVSFISLSKVLPVVHSYVRENGLILALIKPQFEVGKREVEKGGIIRTEEKRLRAISNIQDFSEKNNFKVIGVTLSPIAGQKGNREYFIYLRKAAHG